MKTMCAIALLLLAPALAAAQELGASVLMGDSGMTVTADRDGMLVPRVGAAVSNDGETTGLLGAALRYAEDELSTELGVDLRDPTGMREWVARLAVGWRVGPATVIGEVSRPVQDAMSLRYSAGLRVPLRP